MAEVIAGGWRGRGGGHYGGLVEGRWGWAPGQTKNNEKIFSALQGAKSKENLKKLHKNRRGSLLDSFLAGDYNAGYIVRREAR